MVFIVKRLEKRSGTALRPPLSRSARSASSVFNFDLDLLSRGLKNPEVFKFGITTRIRKLDVEAERELTKIDSNCSRSGLAQVNRETLYRLFEKFSSPNCTRMRNALHAHVICNYIARRTIQDLLKIVWAVWLLVNRRTALSQVLTGITSYGYMRDNAGESSGEKTCVSVL